MVAVYSFWSKPLRENGKIHNYIEPILFISAFYLSVLYAKRNFKKVKLVTDSYGYNLLIKKYKFPFDEISLELNDIENINKEYWAYGKIIAYELQNEPFIHFDWDSWVVNKKNIPLKSQIIVQNKEWLNDRDFYIQDVKLLRSLGYKSNVLYYPIDYAFNTGVFGGNNLKVIKEYCKEAKNIVKFAQQENITNNLLVGKNLFSCIFEQYLLSAVCKKYNIEVTEIAKDYKSTIRNTYHHIWGAKGNKDITERVFNLLRSEFPDEYQKLITTFYNRG